MIARAAIASFATACLFATAAHAADKQLYIIGVFHADVSNSFSSVVKRGVEQAGKDSSASRSTSSVPTSSTSSPRAN